MDTSFFGDANFAEFGGPSSESTPVFPSSSNDPFGSFADPFADFGSAAVPTTGRNLQPVVRDFIYNRFFQFRI